MAVKTASPLLIEIFSRNRSRLNSMYAFIQHTRAELKPEVFTGFLVPLLEELADNLKAQSYPLMETLVLELYDKILLLTAKNLIGNRGKYPFFEDCLHRLLCHFPALVLEQPGDFTAAFANGILNVTRHTGAAVQRWLELLLKLPPDKLDFTALKKTGLVAAWINGMAAYRTRALEYCKTMDESCFSLLFGLEQIKPDTAGKNKIVEKMEQNPWLTPHDILADKQSTDTVAVKTIGSFSGFGGVFPVPPEVFLAGDFPAVLAADSCYRIYADCYGSALVRMDSETTVNSLVEGNREWEIPAPGIIRFRGRQYTLAEKFALPAASMAGAGSTLCFTTAVSHRIFIAGIKDA